MKSKGDIVFDITLQNEVKNCDEKCAQLEKSGSDNLTTNGIKSLQAAVTY